MPTDGRPVDLHPLAYLIGLEGVALLRAFSGEYDRQFTLDRLAEVRRLLDLESELGDGATVSAMATGEGYADWAPRYDQANNLLIRIEEPVVRSILDGLPVGTALDAACGTARHGGYLTSLGHRVIGVDASPEMLAVARRKRPDCELLEGDLHVLPLPDDAVDTVVCGLALMHVPDLGAIFREFRRVLRPGGHIVTSDFRGIIGEAIPPLIKRGPDGQPRYIIERARRTSTYITAALDLGLIVRRCQEVDGPTPFVDEHGVAAGDQPREHTPGQPPDRWALHQYAPAATNAAYHDVPYVLVCHFQLPEG